MKLREVPVWIALVVSGVALRFAFTEIPNFAPVAAIALFSGYFFHNRIAAITAPLAVMLVTDARLGGYEPVMMAAVYGGLALPVFLGGPLRRSLPLDGNRGALASIASLFGSALLASVAFFLITNMATWWVSGMYEHTVAGLVRCYVAALPFFRFTFAGDAAFAVAFFGAFAACRIWMSQRSVAAAAA